MSDERPLTKREESTLRLMLRNPSPMDPPVATRMVLRPLASLDEARAEIVKIVGTRVLPFRKPDPIASTTSSPDPAA